MRQKIIDAINGKRVLSFEYDGHPRVVEPHTVGVSTAGNPVLRCFQTAGSHVRWDHDWNLCTLDKIVNLKETGETFAEPRPGYKKGDRGMSVIHAEL